MEKYLVGVDLDNTLLTDDKTITDETVQFVRNFVARGNYFVIATGRPFQGALDFYKRLGVNMPLIATNGGAIFFFNDDLDTTKEVVDFSMDKNTFLSLFKEVKHMLWAYQVRCPFSYHYLDYNKIPFYILHESPRVSMHENDIETSLINNPIDADFCVNKEFKDEFERIINNYPQFKYISWGEINGYYAYEVSSINSSKGIALDYLRKKYDIKKDNVFGFGDQLNDLDLLKVHYGCAMINATDEIKNLANYVTKKDNNNNGVIEFISEILNKNN